MIKKNPINYKKIKGTRATLRATNCLSEILRELMDERGIEPKHIYEATGIPFSSISDWYLGKVKAQTLNGNILALAQFFNVSIHYLAFGIGSDDPVFDESPWIRYRNRE